MIRRPQRPQRPTFRLRLRLQRGIALLEALLAVLLLAIGLIGTVGLQARSMAAMTDASMRAEATMAAEHLLGIMNSDQANLAGYAKSLAGAAGPALAPWYNDTRTRIPNAQVEVVVTRTGVTRHFRVDVLIKWTRKAGAYENKYTVNSHIAASQ